MSRGERDREGRAGTGADLTAKLREEVHMTSHAGTEEAHDHAEEARGAGRDGMRGERGALRGSVAA